jgi:arylsulfatase A-like enzyme
VVRTTRPPVNPFALSVLGGRVARTTSPEELMNLIVSILLVLITIAAQAFGSEKPNILFILTDDQRWDSLGCYGNRVIKTPNFDRLASQGARLDAFYVAAPLCCPSRATFLSGLYPHQTGITSNGAVGSRPDFSPGTMTIAGYLKQADYITGFSGKAHLGGDPRKWGFQNCPVYLSKGESRYENPRLFREGKPKVMTGQITTIFADAAIAFIEQNKDKRWFLWFASTAPHEPYTKDKRFEYKESQITAPPGWPQSQPFQPNEEWSAYYSTISVLDEQVGRVLKKIDDLELTNNTFVLITSDNGYMMGSHNINGKGTWYEESVRVPAIARWPGKIKSAISVSRLISSVDVLPTFLQLAGLPLPAGLEGVSMIPALLGQSPLRKEAFSVIGADTYVVRQDDWKYVKVSARSEILYNLKIDPSEQKKKDLSKDPKHASVLQNMKKSLEQFLKKTESAKQAEEKIKKKTTT